MASGHVNRIKRPNTWPHRPMLQNVKKALANPEPSTHGHFSDVLRQSSDVRCWGMNRPKSAAPEGRLLTQRGHRTAKDNIAVTLNFAFSEHLFGNV